jgi:hypothetical protein
VVAVTADVRYTAVQNGCGQTAGIEAIQRAGESYFLFHRDGGSPKKSGPRIFGQSSAAIDGREDRLAEEGPFLAEH